MRVASFGYRIVAPPARQPDLAERLHSLVCEHLQLCASVGCGCVTGNGPVLCYESQAGDRHPIHHSEGPHWSVVLRRLPTHLILDIHASDTIYHTETQDLYLAICDLAEQQGCGAVSVYSQGVIELPDGE